MTDQATPKLAGSTANGRLICSTDAFRDGKWVAGVAIDVAVDSRLQLTGDACLPSGETVKVEMPIP